MRIFCNATPDVASYLIDQYLTGRWVDLSNWPVVETYANIFGTKLWLPFSIQHCDLLNWDASVFCSVKLMGENDCLNYDRFGKFCMYSFLLK